LTRIALIAPPYTADHVAGKTASMKAVVNLVPPLGLAYLAAVLEQHGYPARIYDCTLGLSLDSLMAALIAFQPRVVGITSTTPAFEEACITARRIRSQMPESVLVLGGAHVSAVPALALAGDDFDIGVVGEGEWTMLDVARHIEQGASGDLAKVPGLAIRREGRVVVTEPRPYIQDLDRLPMPARGLLPPLAAYSPTPASYRRLPLATVITSRGCPYRCTFCDRTVFGNAARAHSPERVLAEVDECLHRHKALEIRFFDDTFTFDPRRVMEICDGLRAKRWRFPWTCLTHVNTVTPELLRRMRAAGCWQVLYGLESGDPEILASLRKGSTVERNEQAVRWAQEAGLSVRGDFIVGTPLETWASLRRTVDFAKRLKLDYAHFNKFVPFAGSELHDRLAAQGHCPDISRMTSICDHQTTPYVPPALTADQFQRFLNEAHIEFYLRPSHILRRLVRTRSWGELWGQFRGAFAIFGLSR